MKKMKPLQEAGSVDSIDYFKTKMGKLGFTVSLVGKPEEYAFETDTHSSPYLRNLTPKSRESIESWLDEKGADGALIIHSDYKERVADRALLVLTLLPYKLMAKSE